MKYYIVDAFTDHPFGGNPAGVVLLEGRAFPDEGLMLKVAAELRYSETAFVRQDGGREFTLRYFTPRAEVELCGHATIASFHLLHSLGLADGPCLCHTKAGDLTVEAGNPVMMQMAKPKTVSTIQNTEEIYNALGMVNYVPTLPIMIVSTGLPDIMIPVDDVETLNRLRPNMNAVSEITEKHKAVSFHVFALTASTSPITAHVRDFAPLYDIPEESATGTANASLAYYLTVNSPLQIPVEYRFLQGETMGRPSVVAVRLDTDDTAYVGGSAAVVAQGELLVGF